MTDPVDVPASTDRVVRTSRALRVRASGGLAAAAILISAASPSAIATAQVLPVDAVVHQGFAISASGRPTPLRTGAGTRLSYELHLTSHAAAPLALVLVRLVDNDSGDVLASLEGEGLALALGASSNEPSSRLEIGPNAHAVVYIDLPLHEGRTPRRVRHEIVYLVQARAGAFQAMVTETIDLADEAPPRLGPPLRGGPWVAVYSPALERGHRRVIYAIDGRARIPGRYAIDWMKPGPNAGPASNGLGADVLAVADGVVIALRDDVPEPVAGQAPGPVSLGDATGNYIALDIGDGRFAFYEHLMPGHFVGRGDRVERGQVIGRLGTTGQASRPHLHFHLADGISPLGAEGLPYLIEDAQAIGRYPSFDAFRNGEPWLEGATEALTGPHFPEPIGVFNFATPGPSPQTGQRAGTS